MKHLWSPWRLEYVKDPNKQETDGECIFCRLAKESENAESLVLHKNQYVYAMLNKYPYNNGHMMILPTRHLAKFTDLKPVELDALMKWTQSAIGVLEREVSAQGFNVGMNVGQVAGAGIVSHIHMHIVPRWAGDTNFMPILAEVKCIPDHLTALFERLHGPMKKALGN